MADKLKKEKHELIKALIQTEAEINKTEKAQAVADKRTRQIKESSMYKAAGPVKKLGRGDSREQEIRMLKAELDAVKKALQETKEALSLSKLDNGAMNSIRINNAVREMRDDASLVRFIDEAVRQKRQHDENYIQALTYAGRLFMNEQEAYRETVYTSLLPGFKIEDIPEFMMREAMTDTLQLKQAASFRASLNMRMRQFQLTGNLPEFLLDDKQTAYAFMDRLKIRRPWTSDETYKTDDLPLETSTVVKPADGAGARGVYLIHDAENIIDLKRARQLDSQEALKASMKEDIQSGWVAEDEWMMEELILEDEENRTPGSDIKFYCFYGKVGLVLEIRRYPELKYCWWTADGERVHTGKYDNDPFKGRGVTPEEIEMARKISKEIPAPFIRIDFLKSGDGLVFGEFTPKPGNYDEFDTETDQWMGDMYLEAEDRLLKDLLKQRPFNSYMGLETGQTP
ncbi:ATP-grasp fold amidoligase family protein [Lacicoccus alkaliphilus]|uniref:Glutathione synthase/RimK-type ligase, ATP-grasp superfamily n=1 Tax=Lacicoccus alkaliphilus DSM 16010 TaxID=1123231 RepID=A0A1M7H661_9BACL|nr:ATP-grasp fold amidoligase family protein [Salinicoccus alkaliphilus]SHM24005.1 Glutathione synthase/RimK-type ligase, ATP-grasp superfamily [Salinicoccus alkaliphilus DSM 16010]